MIRRALAALTARRPTPMASRPAHPYAAALALALAGTAPIFGPVALGGPPALAAQETTLIRGGRVLDGTGNPWIYADVLLRGDRIEAVGDLGAVRADRVVDATGKYVAPGFIDSHSHAGDGLATEGLSHARPLLVQGVTTIFANPDGGGPVDLAAQREELLAEGLGVNVAPFIGHGSVRSEILGSDDRAPNASEMDLMKALVEAAMEEGAWGLSSGTFYVPGAYSEPAEIEELARVVAPYGGAYQSHYRDESTYTVGLIAAVDEVIDVGRAAGIPAVLTHVKALGPFVWGYGAAIVARVERAREEGVQVFADQYPYTASATSLGAALLPRWSQAGGQDSLLARMARPADMARIREGMVEGLARRGGADRIQFRRYRPDETIEGRLLSDVARERGQDPIETSVDLLKEGSVSIVSFNMSEDDVEVLMAQPWTMTSSDGDLVPWNEGVPHPRSYGTFPRKIGVYARDQGVVSLDQAVRSMTSLPAWVYGLPDRGVLRAGAMADVVVFDLARIRDTAEYTDPHQLAEGMDWVFVNGRAAIADGAFQDVRAGQVLRKTR